jgi:hypothetical protein
MPMPPVGSTPWLRAYLTISFPMLIVSLASVMRRMYAVAVACGLLKTPVQRHCDSNSKPPISSWIVCSGSCFLPYEKKCSTALRFDPCTSYSFLPYTPRHNFLASTLFLHSQCAPIPHTTAFAALQQCCANLVSSGNLRRQQDRHLKTQTTGKDNFIATESYVIRVSLLPTLILFPSLSAGRCFAVNGLQVIREPLTSMIPSTFHASLKTAVPYGMLSRALPRARPAHASRVPFSVPQCLQQFQTFHLSCSVHCNLRCFASSHHLRRFFSQ